MRVGALIMLNRGMLDDVFLVCVCVCVRGLLALFSVVDLCRLSFINLELCVERVQ